MIVKIKAEEVYERSGYSFEENFPINISVNIKKNSTYKNDFTIVMNNEYRRCYYNILKNKYAKGIGSASQTTVILDNNENVIGNILLRSSNNRGWKYEYDEVNYNGETYDVYDTCSETNYYLMMYKNGQVVGAVEKDRMVYDHKDSYTLYCDNIDILMLLTILTIRWDSDIGKD